MLIPVLIQGQSFKGLRLYALGSESSARVCVVQEETGKRWKKRQQEAVRTHLQSLQLFLRLSQMVKVAEESEDEQASV